MELIGKNTLYKFYISCTSNRGQCQKACDHIYSWTLKCLKNQSDKFVYFNETNKLDIKLMHAYFNMIKSAVHVQW